MLRHYEITFLVDPVLSKEELTQIPNVYADLLKSNGCEIVYIDHMGLRHLAYPINKKNTAVYYCIEFTCTDPQVIDQVELAMRRDERIMRFLTVKLDKHGVEYNALKRKGIIPWKEAMAKAKAKKEQAPQEAAADQNNDAPSTEEKEPQNTES